MFFERLSSYFLANPWVSSHLPQSSYTPNATSVDFPWDTTEPSQELVYHDCFGKFKCARLQVPMNWNEVSSTDEDSDKTVEIAVIKVEATVPITDPTYGGAVVLNPGGPGGSGIDQVINGGYDVRTILSAESGSNSSIARNFDIIGFDPRGVNNTRPFFSCFPNQVERGVFDLQTEASGVFGSSDMAFETHWVKTRAMADSCSRRSLQNGIGRHMTTANVARDIVEIFERHGQWREKEASRLLASPVGKASQVVMKNDGTDQTFARLRYRPGQEMIQYWGFSYGTILGATLSAMFPERIARAVLDGVADSFDYMNGEWLTNLQDTDLLIPRFADYCWQGGEENCAVWHADGPAVIIENFGNAVSDLKSHPMGIPGNDTRGPDIVTYSDLKRVFWQYMYNPLANFSKLARILDGISQGNGTALLATKKPAHEKFNKGLPAACEKDGPYSPSCYPDGTGLFEATAGIMCTDAIDQTNMTKAEYWSYAQQLMSDSRLIGDTWGTIRLPCTAWHARPTWRYEGNFVNTTAHPIMLIGNTVDSVTPLRNAFRMAEGFEGSVVLHQDSEGHCSYASPSLCTGRTLRRYFQTGELPAKGTICEPNRLPLDGFSEEEKPALPEGETDEELWRAMVSLNRVWGV